MRKTILITGLFLVCINLWAQKKATPVVVKKPLTHAVYDGWRDVSVRAITPDGSYAALIINPQDGDGRVEFTNLKTFTVDSVKRADNLILTYDSRYAVMKIKPQQKLVKELRRQKKKKEELPKDSLGIFSMNSRKVEKIPEVRSFKVPEKAGEWLAYQLEPRKEAKAKPDEKKPKKKKINSDDNGYMLVLRSMSGTNQQTFGYVKDYVFARFGQGLLFTSTGNDSTMKAGVYWYDLPQQKLTLLHAGKSKFKYKGLAISEDGT
jgi:arginine repressor